MKKEASVPALPEAAQGSAEGMETPLLEAEDIVAEKQKKHAQALFDAVSEHLRREPAQITRLLQSWIHTE